MLECNEIDGLMMDWLYNELDPASAARVADHVEACDRCTAEAGAIRRTREAFRSLSDAEPPAAVSAILLHEAARRAPAAAAEAHARPAVPDSPSSSGSLGERLRAWLRPLFLHPAAAAVCTLVLVAGVAGTLYVRHGWDMMRERPRQAAPAAPVDRGEKETAGEANLEATGAGVAGDRSNGAEAEAGDLERGAAAAAPATTTTADKGVARDADQAPAGYTARLLDQKRQREVEKASTRPSHHGAASESQPERTAFAQPGARTNRRGAERKPVAAGPVANAVSGADPLVDGTDEVGGGGGDRRAHGRVGATGLSKSAHLGSGAAAPTSPVTGTRKASPSPDQGGQFRGRAETTLDDDGGRTYAAPPPALKKGEVVRDLPEAQAMPQAQAAQEVRSRPLSAAELRWLASEEVNLARAIKAKQCGLAARIANDMRDRDPGYYARQVASSKDLARCRSYVVAEARRRQVVRAKQAARERAAGKSAGSVPAKAKAAPRKDEAASQPASR